MLKPSVELTRDLTISTYSLVVGIAKKARAISAAAEDRGDALPDKPVDLAVQEYIDKNFTIVETDPCPVCGRLNCICEKKPAEEVSEETAEEASSEAAEEAAAEAPAQTEAE